MKIVFWGTYDTGKPRIRILREGLRLNGVEVIECHATVWEGIEDKSVIRGSLRRIGLGVHWLAQYPGLLFRYMCLPKHDAVLVSYPGFVDMLVIRTLAWIRGVDVLWDVFMSTYDTVVLDRKLLVPTHPFSWILKQMEGIAARSASLCFLDTEAHARYFESIHSLPAGKCGQVWVGVEQNRFKPTAGEKEKLLGHALRVLFYGQLSPLHGISIVLQAARKLRDENIEWVIIGSGQESEILRSMLNTDPLHRLTWIPWVDYTQLYGHIAASDVCLGIFGTSRKAACVIPNKVFQALAMGRPIISRDSPAIREILSPDGDCVQLVPAGDADALAEAVRQMSLHPNRHQRCHVELQGLIDAKAIGKQFLKMYPIPPGRTDRMMPWSD